MSGDPLVRFDEGRVGRTFGVALSPTLPPLRFLEPSVAEGCSQLTGHATLSARRIYRGVAESQRKQSAGDEVPSMHYKLSGGADALVCKRPPIPSK